MKQIATVNQKIEVKVHLMRKGLIKNFREFTKLVYLKSDNRKLIYSCAPGTSKMVDGKRNRRIQARLYLFAQCDCRI